MAIVIFNVISFKTQYPEFNTISESTLFLCFNEACLYLSNSDNSPIQNIAKREMMLNMLTAHVAFIKGKLSSDGQPKPVGRLLTAAEGSVSTRFEFQTKGMPAWYAQSQYGASFWQATNNLRGFRYMSKPTVY